MCPVRRSAFATLALLTIGAGGRERALGQAEFEGGDLIEEIGLARLAEEAGDAHLAAHLADPNARQAALIATRASPYAHAPEALVPALAELACGRDPVLAPEAAHALHVVAERLAPVELAAREVLKSDLARARSALACAERDPSTRPDVALSLAELAAALDALVR